MSKKKLGFSLSGGGARGVAHAGFLQAMEEEGIKADVISGCSMGAVVGGCYSAGISTSTLKRVLTKMKKKDLLDLNINPLKNRSVFAGKKMEAILKKYLGNTNIENLPITYGCIASDLISGKIVDLVGGDLVTAIQASSAIPAMFAPIECDGKLLVDGGLLVRNPVKLAKKLGADVVVAVDVLGRLSTYRGADNLFEIGTRSFSIIDNNYCASRGKKIADLVIYPQLDDISVFKFDNLKTAYDKGYEAGKNAAPEIKKLVS